MDHIQDLSVRAVSFITFMQDTILKGSVFTGEKLSSTHIRVVFGPEFPARFDRCLEAIHQEEEKSAALRISGMGVKPEFPYQMFSSKRTAMAFLWLSAKPPEAATEGEVQQTEALLREICIELSKWIIQNVSYISESPDDLLDAFATPQAWREAILRCLNRHSVERVRLSEVLEYLPIQLVLALGGCAYCVNEQRILQWWQSGEKKASIPLTEKEQVLRTKFLQVCYASFQDERKGPAETMPPEREELKNFYESKISALLQNYSYVTERLLKREVPLSFPYILAAELDEIEMSRQLREKENQVKRRPGEPMVQAKVYRKAVIQEQPVDSRKEEASCSPMDNAQAMNLFALAFSGGGIRSATFNLGLLQGLSKKGMLSQVDYLSTVSGGGYIGSWLATWIKRSGSVAKVQDRLNPEVSPDPLGEEVRPIRWLRMFSNYLAPDKSIMSIDSWTMVITWLRNTLLNQIVILLALLSLMLVFRIGFLAWTPKTGAPGELFVYFFSCGCMVFLAYLTGLGMQWYHRGPHGNATTRIEQKQNLTALVAAIAIAGALVASSFMYGNIKSFSLKDKLPQLWPVAAVIFVILLVIALIGRYDRCIRALDKEQLTRQSKIRPYWILVETSLLGAGVSWLALAGIWKVMSLLTVQRLGSWKIRSVYSGDLPDELAFTVGVPMLLLVLGTTVVSRMAFLGRYFPDERREWWGRMGAIINRIAFLWLVVSASAMLLDDALRNVLSGWQKPASIGGWMALVGGAVKAAYNGKTSGKGESEGAQSKILEWISKAAPYLFLLGLLVFLPHVVDWLLSKDLPNPYGYSGKYIKPIFYVALFLLVAWYLSKRLGVNEFSMHHFYRNRLVRAYLGASRPRVTRDRTANPFTGFDKLDDEKLSLFRNCQGYYGPYPVINAALNASRVTDLSRQDRKAESFIFTPLFSGFDFSRARSSANQVQKSYDYGYRPTGEYAYPNDLGPGIGTAMAISGAAANPNMGYHSSAGTAFLLTVFNVQLGWWMGNPRKSKWKKADPGLGLAYVFYNMTAQTNTSNDFVCLSDGGHFDNMGLYEMVRRRCAYVIVCDGEQDEEFSCEGLANAIRRCRIDFGAEIEIDIKDIVKREGRFSQKHYAVGSVRYSGEKIPSGKLIYVKASLTGNEPVDVKEYAMKNEGFPHQSTGDQFFDEQQFESYRKLGLHIADELMNDTSVFGFSNGGAESSGAGPAKPQYFIPVSFKRRFRKMFL